MSGKRPGKKPNPKKPVDREAVSQKRDRRDRAAAIRVEQERGDRRRKMLMQVGLVAVVALIAVAVAVGLLMNRTPDKVAAPPGFADSNGAFVVGAADAPVSVTVVEDFSCPHCATTEAATRDLFASYAEGADVRVDYRPIAFLDSSSKTDYATRALNTAVCVVEEDQGNWDSIHQALMENQPSLGGPGLPDNTLIDLAADSGADRKSVSKCINDRKHKGWVDYTTDRATKEPDFEGTPAVYVDDKRVEKTSPEAIDAAVQAALKS